MTYTSAADRFSGGFGADSGRVAPMLDILIVAAVSALAFLL